MMKMTLKLGQKSDHTSLVSALLVFTENGSQLVYSRKEIGIILFTATQLDRNSLWNHTFLAWYATTAKSVHVVIRQR